jgi:uroporphyrinogen-III synthase
MNPSSSLKGKRVLVPRGKNSAKSFSSIVEGYGGIPVEVPLLDFRPVDKAENIEPIKESLHTYDWIIFTSNVTVETFFTLVKGKNVSLPKIAVIGEKTELALNNLGIKVDFKPKEYVAESFVKEFEPFVKPGEKLLIPKGNLARDVIAQFFRDKGHDVDEVIIYETFFPAESKEKLVQLLKDKSIDVLPFTSPSTIEHFMRVVDEYNLHDSLEDCVIAVIGPISKRKCEALSLKVHVMPEVYTSYNMITEVVSYLNK